MAELLADNPFLLLFLVAALGFLAGRVRILGFRLGVAAVLFVGLGFGALGPDVRLPDFVYLFGLVLFVYTVGLAGGPGFVAALRRRGLRDNALALAVLVLAGVAVAVAAAAADLDGAQASGLFAGSLTNTPALAAVLDYLGDAGGVDLTVPVIAYSVTYPMGVLGVILAISVLQRLWRVDYAAEAHALRDEAATGERIDDVSVVVTNPDMLGRTVEDLVRTATPRVVYGRILRSGQPQDVVGADTRLAAGDVVTIIGTADHVASAVGALGRVAEDPLVFDREALDIRRIFVSSNDVVGRTIGELGLPYRFGAIATRVRRGDVDVLATADLRLLPGDRVRVLAPRSGCPRSPATSGIPTGCCRRSTSACSASGSRSGCSSGSSRSHCRAVGRSNSALQAGRCWSDWRSVPWCAPGRSSGSCRTTRTSRSGSSASSSSSPASGLGRVGRSPAPWATTGCCCSSSAPPSHASWPSCS